MRSFSLRKRFSRLFGCALLFVAGIHLWAQSSDSSLHKNGIKAHTTPISNTQILFQVTLPSGQITNLAVQEGGMAKASDYHQGSTYAFVPMLKNAQQKSVDFTVFLIIEDKEGNESIHQVERMNGSMENPALSQSQPKLQIRLTSINPPSTQASLPNHKKEPVEIKVEMGPAVDCCVTCGLTSACAGSVCLSCGSCNDPDFPPIDCSGNASSTLLPFDLNRHHSKLALVVKDKEAPLPAQPKDDQTQNQQ